ncbi:MAG: PqqD family protein [Lachnospiraceae bacterium]|nr:PqqD family protein [Lachnospiraceae bacterium]MBQ2101390.1 PqqD family protein [Lachnospiraceae bacterium]MBQ3905327.1 PqqD family protein [Lachnospiraceae bacterium]MCR4600056.1 PqqD family protein [Acetatifactor sp.]
MSETQRYQLREAAGKYWLLDMEQKPGKYFPPIAMNETGAMILTSYWKKNDPKDAATLLSDTYEITLEEALSDVNDFLSDLKRKGIAL